MADLLRRAMDAGTVVADLPEALAPRTLAEAERVQDALLAHPGTAVGAWKLGATNRPARDALGLDRQFMGAVAADRVLAAPARIAAAALRQTVIEGEIAFRFGRDLPPRPGGHDAAAVRAAVASAHAAIEVPASRFPALGAFGGCALVADHGAAGWLVVGPGGPLGDPADWDDRAVAMTVDGAPAAAGTAAAILGTPFGVLVEHVRQASARGITLRAGQYVATGNVAGVGALAPGGTAVVTVAGLEPAALTLVPAGPEGPAPAEPEGEARR
ncbi:fumarylacetoacetate hydrolase family protein [Azospirillum sp. ST 5-10]|uniref:fumarylacetoacetate hydrolase family protein n=1 Tax=unclassified Azospirillum TaxID=2630922 RepID=UPI003F4A6D30